MKNILICGYYGFKNLGDETLLLSIHDLIKEISPSSNVEALTYHMDYTSNFLGIKSFSRGSIGSMLKKIKSVDCIVFGGGSLLQDSTSSRSLMYYLGIMYFAKMNRKKVIILGNGFGPVNKKLNLQLVKFILNRVDAITIRDEKEFNYLRNIGIGEHMHLAADLAFNISKKANIDSKLSSDKLLADIGPKSDKPIVGISLRPWKNVSSEFEESIIRIANKAYSDGYEILFLPMQQNLDVAVSNSIREKLEFDTFIVDRDIQPYEMLNLVGRCHHIVSMRLHTLIFASILNIPMVGIDYNPKIDTHLSSMGQPCLGKIETLSAKISYDIYVDFLNNIEDYKSVLPKNLEKLSARSILNSEVLKEQINEI